MSDMALKRCHANKRITKLSGFTLVELLLVLAIITILISLALPSYLSVTQKSQRTEGQVILLEIQSYLERYYFTHHTYPDSLSKLRHYQRDKVNSDNAYYEVMLEADQSCPSGSCFLLIAKHISGEEAETLSLSSSGDKKGPW